MTTSRSYKYKMFVSQPCTFKTQERGRRKGELASRYIMCDCSFLHSLVRKMTKWHYYVYITFPFCCFFFSFLSFFYFDYVINGSVCRWLFNARWVPAGILLAQLESMHVEFVVSPHIHTRFLLLCHVPVIRQIDKLCFSF